MSDPAAKLPSPPPPQPMTAAIALGSNLGDRAANLRQALTRLAALGTVTAVSRFHDTAPVGLLAQPRFLNAAALLETALPPLDLLDALLAIEKSMGRDRATSLPKGPRLIDLDLLLYGDNIMHTAELHLPHPELHRRLFVLTPLAEIAPSLRHPILGRTITEIEKATSRKQEITTGKPRASGSDRNHD